MSARYGRWAKTPARTEDRHHRQIPVISALRSPVWLAAALLVLAGAGASAYAASASSTGTSTGTPATGGLAPITGTQVPRQTTTPFQDQIGSAPGPLVAHPGGATTDGGGFNDVSCPSVSECVAVGADGSGTGVIEISNSGGSSFSSQKIPNALPNLSSVSCVGATTCVAVGGSDVVTSADGGQTWASQSLPEDGLMLLGVQCQGPTQCLAGGVLEPHNAVVNQAVIVRSTDGGKTWGQATITGNVAEVSDLACPTTTRCIAVGSSVLVSNDAGATWNTAPVVGEADQLTSIACPSSTLCVAVGPNPLAAFEPKASGDAIETSDGGNTFAAVTLPASSGSMFEVSCASATSCNAAGVTGSSSQTPVFLSSTNGGTGWTSVASPPGFSAIAGLSCSSGGSCVAVGHATSGSSSVPSVAVLSNPGSPSSSWSEASPLAINPTAN